MSKPIFPVEGEQLVMPEFAETPKNEETAVTDDVNADRVTPTDDAKDDVTDLDISVTAKKKFRFDRDNSRVVEIDTSDVSIISRISDAYPRLQELQTKASKIMEDVDFDSNAEADMKKVSTRLKKVDKEMRDLIDFIFDSDVSSKAAPSGSMYDPFNGSFRFEYILTALINQYEQNLTKEYTKMAKQLNEHTAKYTKG